MLIPSFLVDGTDVPIMEPKNTTWRQKAKFYSHKLGGPALRYLIGTHVETGEIVWASSAYPAGTYEPKILEIEVADLLIPGEKALADRLFANNPLFITRLPHDCLITRTYDSVRSKIERVNRDLKCFYILKNSHTPQLVPVLIPAIYFPENKKITQ